MFHHDFINFNLAEGSADATVSFDTGHDLYLASNAPTDGEVHLWYWGDKIAPADLTKWEKFGANPIGTLLSLKAVFAFLVLSNSLNVSAGDLHGFGLYTDFPKPV